MLREDSEIDGFGVEGAVGGLHRSQCTTGEVEMVGTLQYRCEVEIFLILKTNILLKDSI